MISRRKRPRKRSERGKLFAEADRLFSLLVRDRDKKCLNPKCGSTAHLQAAHILPKGSHPRLRYDWLNVITLCAGCHLKWHDNAAYKEPWFVEAFETRESQLRIIEACAAKVDIKAVLAGLRIAMEQLNAQAIPH